ncbi:MAG: DUF1059 domain-containing protein [Acidimicrobiia bacterium]|nr:DUF1059 domain-containing protein [Acidimicrobiia bacterium]
MKRFACGDVVPGCSTSFTCRTDDEILAEVARHAADAHGLEAVPDDVVEAVKAKIVTV